MQKTIEPHVESPPLTVVNELMKQVGKAANKAAGRRTFTEHTAKKADNTMRRKQADLALFETFLNSRDVPLEL